MKRHDWIQDGEGSSCSRCGVYVEAHRNIIRGAERLLDALAHKCGPGDREADAIANWIETVPWECGAWGGVRRPPYDPMPPAPYIVYVPKVSPYLARKK